MADKTLKAMQITETQGTVETEMLREQLAEYGNVMQNMQMQLEENMSNLSQMSDIQGWIELSTYGTDGPTLYQVQDVAKRLRNLTGLNAHMGKGSRLRHSYIWQGGIKHEGIPEAGRGRVNIQAIIDDSVNQANFFGAAARERQEKACYTAGHYIVVGQDAVAGGVNRAPKRLMTVPIWQITAAMTNPDDPSEVWAIRRSWSDDAIVDGTNVLNGSRGDLQHEWIYVNAHKTRERASVTFNGGSERVNRSKRAFIETVNKQDGWQFGLPDAVAAFAWTDQYRRGVLNGLQMQSALATLAYKLTGRTAAGAKNASVKVADTTVKGGTAALVDGMDMTALSTAGRGYDFDSLRPVLAIVATALDVSVVALSSDPGAAGSSYGSAQNLDLPTRLAMEARRQLHVELELEILKWLGVEDPKVWFDSLVDNAELYRGVQSILLKWNSGLFQPEEVKMELESLFGHETIDGIPDGVMLPNNVASLPRKDIDTDSAGVPATTAAPDQGQSDNVGGQGTDSGNDLRTDTIA